MLAYLCTLDPQNLQYSQISDYNGYKIKPSLALLF